MRQTGHRSLAMVRRYIRDGSLFRKNPAAKLVFDPPQLPPKTLPSGPSGWWNEFRRQAEDFIGGCREGEFSFGLNQTFGSVTPPSSVRHSPELMAVNVARLVVGTVADDGARWARVEELTTAEVPKKTKKAARHEERAAIFLREKSKGS